MISRSKGVAFLAVALAAVPIVTASPVPFLESYPDARVYADAAWHLASGEGYVSDYGAGEAKTPQYPPGFSLALTPFVRWGGDYPESAQLGAKVIAVLLLVAVTATAWLMGGPAAGALAAGIVGVSPFARSIGRMVMSDALAALLTVVVLALIARPTLRRSAVAGALATASVAVRLTNVVTLFSAVVGLRRPRLVAVALAASIPFALAVLVWQWSSFGSPVETGYTHQHSQFGSGTFELRHVFAGDLDGDGSFVVHDRARGALTRWTCPCRDDNPMNGMSNVFFYPAVLLGMYWVYAPPFLTLVGLWELFKRRRTAAGRFALLLGLSTLVLLLPFWWQAARLVAPAAMVLVVFTALGLSRLGARFFKWWPEPRSQ